MATVQTGHCGNCRRLVASERRHARPLRRPPQPSVAGCDLIHIHRRRFSKEEVFGMTPQGLVHMAGRIGLLVPQNPTAAPGRLRRAEGRRTTFLEEIRTRSQVVRQMRIELSYAKTS
jgi:hypothetical protein